MFTIFSLLVARLSLEIPFKNKNERKKEKKCESYLGYQSDSGGREGLKVARDLQLRSVVIISE